MKYLILTSDVDEIFYKLSDINEIAFDYAQNLYNEADLGGNDIKPLEMLTVIHFNDNSTATFVTKNWKMYFAKEVPNYAQINTTAAI